MMVLDASAVVEWLLRSPRGQVLDRLIAADPVLIAPHLLDVEVLSVLRRAVLGRALPERVAADALDALSCAPIRRYPHAPLLRRAFDLRENVSAYDAMYVGLAEVTGATLVTGDMRLLRATPRLIPVELI